MLPYLAPVRPILTKLAAAGKQVIFEGAQGSLLDIDFGTYPYVTSSHTIAAGIGIGSGFPLCDVQTITGVFKSYYTRVGEGPFASEIDDEICSYIRKQGNEFGSTTGRPRRIGWFDAVAAKHTASLNNITNAALTLLDVLSGLKEIKVCTAYRLHGKIMEHYPWHTPDIYNLEPVYETLPGWSEDITQIKEYDKLPLNAQKYVEFIEKHLQTPIEIVSVGPDRTQTIWRKK